MSKKRALRILRAYRRGRPAALLALAKAMDVSWSHCLAYISVVARQPT